MVTAVIIHGLEDSSAAQKIKSKCGLKEESMKIPPHMTLDSAIALAKTEDAYIPETKLEVLKTPTYEYRSSGCNNHNATRANELSPHSNLSLHLKALVASMDMEIIVLSGDTPPCVILDVCHVTKTVVETRGNPEILEGVFELDLCGAAKCNLLADISLSTIVSALYYYSHKEPHPAGSYTFGENTSLLPLSPCGTTSTECIYQDGKAVDLSSMACSPKEQEYCTYLVPQDQDILTSCKANALSIISGLNILIATNTVMSRGLSDLQITGPYQALLKIAVDHLHKNLEVLRACLRVGQRPKCSYYIRANPAGYQILLNPPGYRITVQCVTDVIVPYVKMDESFEALAHFLF